MRKGQNPAKFVKDVARPQRITVALLNYIPFLSGFYAETLDVLKVCMESMRKDAGLPFDLMVFDNGSCAEVRDFLIKEKEEGRIQYLILAEKNMGKGGAWNTMLAGHPVRSSLTPIATFCFLLNGFRVPWKFWKHFQMSAW